jgi:hypothetical protein
MRKNEFDSLKLGDVIRPIGSPSEYFFIVAESYYTKDGTVEHVVQRAMLARHPEQWEIVLKRSS